MDLKIMLIGIVTVLCAAGIAVFFTIGVLFGLSLNNEFALLFICGVIAIVMDRVIQFYVQG